jgi:hypothetical protein
VYILEYACILRSSAGCEDQPCSWVCREGEIKRKKEKDLQLNVQIELYVFIYYIKKHSSVDVALGRG